MTNATKIQYLQKAAMGYIIAGTGFLCFGFPFWFLNAVDEVPKQHNVLPFLTLVDDPFPISFKFWLVTVTSIGMFIGAYSLWKVGEPTGLGTKRHFFFVLMTSAFFYFLSTWMLLPFAPLGAFLHAVGMILVGIASLKTRIWSDWKRYTPLIIGCFPFVFMYPFVVLTGARPPAMIGLWCFPWMLLGIASWLRSKELAELDT